MKHRGGSPLLECNFRDLFGQALRRVGRLGFARASNARSTPYTTVSRQYRKQYPRQYRGADNQMRALFPYERHPGYQHGIQNSISASIPDGIPSPRI